MDNLNKLMTKKTYHAHKDMETVFGKAANKPEIADLVKRLGLTMDDEETGEVILTSEEITQRLLDSDKQLDDLFNYHKNKNQDDRQRKRESISDAEQRRETNGNYRRYELP